MSIAMGAALQKFGQEMNCSKVSWLEMVMCTLTIAIKITALVGMRLHLRKSTPNQGFLAFGQIRTLLSLGIIGGGRL